MNYRCDSCGIGCKLTTEKVVLESQLICPIGTDKDWWIEYCPECDSGAEMGRCLANCRKVGV